MKKDFDYGLGGLVVLIIICVLTALFSVWRIYDTSNWQVESKAFVTAELNKLNKSQEEIMFELKRNQEIILKNQNDYYEKWIKFQEQLTKDKK